MMIVVPSLQFFYVIKQKNNSLYFGLCILLGNVGIVFIDIFTKVKDSILIFSSVIILLTPFVIYLIKERNFLYFVIIGNLLIPYILIIPIILSKFLKNIIFIIMFPIINYIICMIQKAFLNHEINKYLPVVSNYCTIILRNIIYEFFTIGIYLSISSVEELKIFPFVMFTILDYLFVMIRKLKLFEGIYLYYYNRITNDDEELEYNDIDTLDEMAYNEVHIYSFSFIASVLIFNTIYTLEKDLEIIDCKGTPNPKNLNINNNSEIIFLMIFFIRLVFYGLKEIIYKSKDSDYEIKYPLFDSCGLKLTKIFCIHILVMIRGDEIFALGLYSNKLFRY